VIDETRGKAVEMYVSTKPGIAADEQVAHKVSQAIEKDIGKIARPKNVWVVPDMPKTRSGKIMRRVIAGISNFSDVGDISTLANPEIVEDIRQQVYREKLASGETPRELTDKEKQELEAFGHVA
jgi:acetyl-CoA synthetase